MSATDPNGGAPVFATVVVLAKREVFDALEVCAMAERALLRCGRASEAAAVASLFELLEDRIVRDPVAEGTPAPPLTSPNGSDYDMGSAGSNSNDKEFTQ
jgi:hypothetical protein